MITRNNLECIPVYCKTLEEGQKALTKYPHFVDKIKLIDSTYLYLFQNKNATH